MLETEQFWTSTVQTKNISQNIFLCSRTSTNDDSIFSFCCDETESDKSLHPKLERRYFGNCLYKMKVSGSNIFLDPIEYS